MTTTCLTDRCDRPPRARGRCNRCYLRARRAGELELLPTDSHHKLSDIDAATRTATCSVCGPVRVRERRRSRGRWACLVKHRQEPRVRASKDSPNRGMSARALSRVPVNTRDAWLQRAYGMTLVEYDARLNQQDRRCAVCREDPDGLLYVDHCHATGRVRGLLCPRCNYALGWLRDDPLIAEAAGAYLRANRDTDAPMPPTSRR